MASSLLKLLMLSALFVIIVSVVNAMPDADPLPSQIEHVINWLLSCMYFFNQILDIPAFMINLYYCINGFILFIGLIVVRFLANWVINAS